MDNTVGIEEEKIEAAITNLNELFIKLDEIDLKKAKESGGSGSTYDEMELLEVSMENVKEKIKKLIGATTEFLNGVKDTIKIVDENEGKRLEEIK